VPGAGKNFQAEVEVFKKSISWQTIEETGEKENLMNLGVIKSFTLEPLTT